MIGYMTACFTQFLAKAAAGHFSSRLGDLKIRKRGSGVGHHQFYLYLFLKITTSFDFSWQNWFFV